jgi:hypothetical protein
VMGISTSLYFQLLHFLIVRFLACWFSNRNWKNFFIGCNSYKFEEMLFTIK